MWSLVTPSPLPSPENSSNFCESQDHCSRGWVVTCPSVVTHATGASFEKCARRRAALILTARQHSKLGKRCYIAVGSMSVCPSDCLSVTRWYCVKTTQARITKSSLTCSPMGLDSALRFVRFSQKFDRVSLSAGCFALRFPNFSCLPNFSSLYCRFLAFSTTKRYSILTDFCLAKGKCSPPMSCGVRDFCVKQSK